MPQNSLEQEAMDRVRRMYASFDGKRAAQSCPASESRKTDAAPRAAHPASPPDSAHAEPFRAKPQRSERKGPSDQPQSESAAKPGGLLELFMKDKDQSLILLLLVLLMRDGADMNLMLALVYLLI